MVSVSRIHDNHIDARFNQRRHSAIGVRRGADSCGRSQPALFIFAGIGKIFRFENVFQCDESLELKGIINHEDFFDPVSVEQRFYLSKIKVFLNGNQTIFRRHDRIYCRI